MIRLSRKAWNNVIIFAMLLMILLFNTTNNILTGGAGDSQESQLLPAGSRLMTLQMPTVTIERIGQGWRTTPTTSVTERELAALVQRWQTSSMVSVNDDIPSHMPVIVIAWLAGENSGRVFQLYADNGSTLVLHNQQLYGVPDSSLEQLILGGVN